MTYQSREAGIVRSTLHVGYHSRGDRCLVLDGLREHSSDVRTVDKTRRGTVLTSRTTQGKRLVRVSGPWDMSVLEEGDVLDRGLTAYDTRTISLLMSRGVASSSKTINSLEPEQNVKKAREKRKEEERKDDTQATRRGTFYPRQGVSATFQKSRSGWAVNRQPQSRSSHRGACG